MLSIDDMWKAWMKFSSEQLHERHNKLAYCVHILKAKCATSFKNQHEILNNLTSNRCPAFSSNPDDDNYVCSRMLPFKNDGKFDLFIRLLSWLVQYLWSHEKALLNIYMSLTTTNHSLTQQHTCKHMKCDSKMTRWWGHLAHRLMSQQDYDFLQSTHPIYKNELWYHLLNYYVKWHTIPVNYRNHKRWWQQ